MNNFFDKLKNGFIKVCAATETQARISIIVASAILITTVGSVCILSLNSNKDDKILDETSEITSDTSVTITYEDITNATEESTVSTFKDDRIEYLMGNKEGGFAQDEDTEDASSMKDEDVVNMVNSGQKIKTIKKQNLNIGADTSTKNQTMGNHKAEQNAGSAPQAVATSKPTYVEKSNFVLGIDVSKHNGVIDWQKVADFGVKFAIIRVAGRGQTVGALYEDSMYRQNIRGAQAAGIKVGVYIYSQATNSKEALEEASYILELIKGYNINYPVVLDWETDYGFRSYNVKGQDLYNVINTFCKTISQNGYTPMVYMCKSDWVDRLGSYGGTVASAYKVWLAYYYKEYIGTRNFFKIGNPLPNFPYHYDIWQYGYVYGVPGINGVCDMDLGFSGSQKLVNPSITFDNPTIKAGRGSTIDIKSSIHATNSLGKSVASSTSYTITDSSGKEISLETALSSIGKYNVTFSFKDPYFGVISEKTVLEVVDPSEMPSPTPTPVVTTTETSDTSETSDASETSESTTAAATPTKAPESSETTPETSPSATSKPTPTDAPEVTETTIEETSEVTTETSATETSKETTAAPTNTPTPTPEPKETEEEDPEAE